MVRRRIRIKPAAHNGQGALVATGASLASRVMSGRCFILNAFYEKLKLQLAIILLDCEIWLQRK
jgi:hypothetical protein